MLTPSPPEKATAQKAALWKTRQVIAKNLPSLPLANHKQTANYAFYDASSKIILDRQLQNEVANLER